MSGIISKEIRKKPNIIGQIASRFSQEVVRKYRMGRKYRFRFPSMIFRKNRGDILSHNMGIHIFLRMNVSMVDGRVALDAALKNIQDASRLLTWFPLEKSVSRLTAQQVVTNILRQARNKLVNARQILRPKTFIFNKFVQSFFSLKGRDYFKQIVQDKFVGNKKIDLRKYFTFGYATQPGGTPWPQQAEYTSPSIFMDSGGIPGKPGAPSMYKNNKIIEYASFSTRKLIKMITLKSGPGSSLLHILSTLSGYSSPGNQQPGEMITRNRTMELSGNLKRSAGDERSRLPDLRRQGISAEGIVRPIDSLVTPAARADFNIAYKKFLSGDITVNKNLFRKYYNHRRQYNIANKNISGQTYQNLMNVYAPGMKPYRHPLNLQNINGVLPAKGTDFKRRGEDFVFHNERKIVQEVEEIKTIVSETKQELEDKIESLTSTQNSKAKQEVNINRISDLVYQDIERRIRIERERRGL